MQNHIIVAATALFATQANALIQKSPHALVLVDASLAGHDHLTGLFCPDPDRSRQASRSLLSVDVIEGPAEEVEAELDKLHEQNPYIRPLKIIGSVVEIDPEPSDSVTNEDPSTVAKKTAKKVAAKNAKKQSASGTFECSIIAIVGTFQP